MVWDRDDCAAGIIPMIDSVGNKFLPFSMILINWIKFNTVARFSGRYDPTLFVGITRSWSTFCLFKTRIYPTFVRIPNDLQRVHTFKN